MLVKKLKKNEGVEFDLSGTDTKTVRVFARWSERERVIKLFIDADISIPVHGVKTCQDGQKKGEHDHGTDHR
jgi:hypothetical protein